MSGFVGILRSINTLLTCGLSLLGFFIISAVSAVGAAIILFEKADDFPIRFIRRLLSFPLKIVHPKLGEVFDCPVCLGFWTALFCDLFLLAITGGSYFLWPLTGFAAMGIIWLIYTHFDLRDQMWQRILESAKESSQDKGYKQDGGE